jgi:dipeptidyl-peptidase-3
MVIIFFLNQYICTMRTFLFGLGAFFILLLGCGSPSEESPQAAEEFVWSTEDFSDKRMIRYQIPGFENLTLDQKKLVYYLTQAGLSGRDIMYDQNYRHNLVIRDAIDHLFAEYDGDTSDDNWNEFMVYAKNVWFSNGIHHHYSADKFTPGFDKKWFEKALDESGGPALSEAVLTAMFDPAVDAKKIVLDPEQDVVLASAVNFYGPDVTAEEVEAFYTQKKAGLKNARVSLGLNSKVVRSEDGTLKEEVYKADGLYGPAIREIIGWLEKAVDVAENEAQANALRLLIEYYQTGDLEAWDKYNVAWVSATEGDIDYINSFIEVYNDPLAYKGSYESIVQIKDFSVSEKMSVLADNAQWFESQSTTLPEHKKDTVTGISYNFVIVAGESGDASPSTPIGVNLPNANWIRAKYGSKSVSLGNIVEGYDNTRGAGLLEEFSHDQEEIERAKAFGTVASKFHTALHEVIGHASGKLVEGVGTPKETLKNYASALEEARADLVGLYFITDPKLMELGLVESSEVGKASYDSYLKNGLMLQLRRIQPGNSIEQAHMRNRQMVSSWVYEKGLKDSVVVMVERDGKTYIDIRDYDKLRGLFGALLREVQRIKSEGDFAAGRNLIEGYGVQVNEAIHNEVLSRSESLNIPPYGGFINPRLVPVKAEDGSITDIQVEYPDDFASQMLEYGRQYGFLLGDEG